MADDSQGDNWLAYGRTDSEQRYSPLEQVDHTNVNNLKLDWYMDLPNDRGLVSPPLVVAGPIFCRLYEPGPGSQCTDRRMALGI